MTDGAAAAVETPIEAAPVDYGQLSRVLADNCRDAAMSSLYYRAKVGRIRRQARVVDTIVALSSGGSAGGLAVSRSHGFDMVWIVLGAAAAVIALLRPIWFQFDKETEKASSLWRLWSELQEDYLELNERLRIHGPTPALVEQGEVLSSRLRKAQKSDLDDTDDHLVAACVEKVKRMLPGTEFWAPKKGVG